MTCERLEREDMLAYLGEEMDPHIDACPDCRARRAEYQRIAAALGQDSPRPLPAGWMEALQSKLIAKSVASSSPGLPRVDRPWVVPPVAPRRPPDDGGGKAGPGSLARAATRRRTGWLAGAGSALAPAAAVVLVLWPKPRPPSLDQHRVKGPVLYRGAEEAWHTDDVLRLTAHPGEAERHELRIYLDGSRVVFRCPGEDLPACPVDDDGNVVVSYTLPAPGKYEVVWLSSDSAIPGPDGSFDADVGAARASGAHVESGTAIDAD